MTQKRSRVESEEFGGKRRKWGLILAFDDWNAGLLGLEGGLGSELDLGSVMVGDLGDMRLGDLGDSKLGDLGVMVRDLAGFMGDREVEELREEPEELDDLEPFTSPNWKDLTNDNLLKDYFELSSQPRDVIDELNDDFNFQIMEVDSSFMEPPNSQKSNLQGRFVSNPRSTTDIIDIHVWGPIFNRDEYQYWYKFTEPYLEDENEEFSYLVSLRNQKIQDLLHKKFKRELRQQDNCKRTLHIKMTCGIDPKIPQRKFIRGITFKISEDKIIEVSRH